jgi:hypothetical protein
MKQTMQLASVLVGLMLFASVLAPVLAPVMAANPHQLRQLKLMYTTTDPATTTPLWVHMPGNEISTFKLTLNPSVTYYYIDVMKLRPYSTLPNGLHPFFVDITNVPTGYAEYWAGRGADASGAPWQQLLYAIFIAGTEPVFYLSVQDGAYTLIDGFQHLAYGTDLTLRVDGTYLLGTYQYYGTDADVDFTMSITFKSL